MKHEIEIPDLPEGWEAVAYRKTNRDDEAIFWNRRLHQICDSLMDKEFLIVRKKQTHRIVLEQVNHLDAKIAFEYNNAWSYWKIVEDDKCAE